MPTYERVKTITTGDFALIAFLQLRNHRAKMEFNNGVVEGTFDLTDEVQDLINDFTLDRAYVEVRSFNRVFRSVRLEAARLAKSAGASGGRP